MLASTARKGKGKAVPPDIPPGYSRWELPHDPSQKDAVVYGPYFYQRRGRARVLLSPLLLPAQGDQDGRRRRHLQLQGASPPLPSRVPHECRPREAAAAAYLDDTPKIDGVLAFALAAGLTRELALLVTLSCLPMRFAESPHLRSLLQRVATPVPASSLDAAPLPRAWSSCTNRRWRRLPSASRVPWLLYGPWSTQQPVLRDAGRVDF